MREGIRWTRIEKQPGQLDFSTVLPFLRAAKATGIEIIWDLFHFGWPDFLDVFDPSWVEAFELLAAGFASLLRSESKSPYFVAPVNEISFVSWAGGDAACLNPFRTGRGHELKRQLVRGFLASAKAVRAQLPGVSIVSPEPVIHIVGRPGVAGDAEDAERHRLSMFEAWDMILGRSHPDLGGTRDQIDVIGINYYDRNQWWNFGETICPGDAPYRPFHDILSEVWQRYRLPIVISETGTEDVKRAAWFAYISEEVRAAEAEGIPMQGICLYPILNHPGWEDDRHCQNGLWDYSDDAGFRAICEPLAMEIRMQEKIARKRAFESYEQDRQ